MRAFDLCQRSGADWAQLLKMLAWKGGAGAAGWNPSKDDQRNNTAFLNTVPSEIDAVEQTLFVAEVVREELFDQPGLDIAWAMLTPASMYSKGWHHKVSAGHGRMARRVALDSYLKQLHGFLAIPAQLAVVEAFRDALLARRAASAAAAASDAEVLSKTAKLDFMRLAAVARLVLASGTGFSLKKLSPAAAAERQLALVARDTS